MLVVHVNVEVTASSEDSFRDASLSNARSSLSEPGVLRFDVLQDREDPRTFVLVEVYRDEAAATSHKDTAHYRSWRDTVASMMARPRRAQRFDAAFPVEPERWRTPPTSARDTMGWDG